MAVWDQTGLCHVTALAGAGSATLALGIGAVGKTCHVLKLETSLTSLVSGQLVSWSGAEQKCELG